MLQCGLHMHVLPLVCFARLQHAAHILRYEGAFIKVQNIWGLVAPQI
jgi:hypothetical protein